MKYLDQAKKLYAELLEKYPKSDKADLAKRRWPSWRRVVEVMIDLRGGFNDVRLEK